jgi:cobalt-zinc-cadmium efflux system membrane fusion protein
MLALACAGLSCSSARAGGGDDHSHAPPPVAGATQGMPRIALQSDLYEVVGALQDLRLTLHVDRTDDNEPVTDARVTVTLGDVPVVATSNPGGTYVVVSSRLAEPGAIDVVVSISAPAGDDLLIGSLAIPGLEGDAVTQALSGHDHGSLVDRAREALVPLRQGQAWVFGIFAAGLGLGLLLRSRRARPVSLVTVGILVLVSTGFAFAHGGEDHDHDAPVAVPRTNTPQRMPDGAVFVPKSSQRILEVRTTVARPATVEAATRLIGKVIPDPNRGGLVQSIGGGRVIAPPAGMPQLGQAVRKGDVLAHVERPIIQADQAIVVEKVGEIEQMIGLAEAKLARAKRLVTTGSGTTISVSDLEIELEGMRRRRAAVSDIRSTPETLTSPADGVIASSRVVAGQVVQGQDVLFQVVDPKNLWVEALAFETLPPLPEDATALTVEGVTLKLVPKGVSRALQQQATVVQFAVVEPPADLRVGQPVTVLSRTGASATGIVLPRNAVVRSGNGEAMVWRHVEPERFEPRPVRTEPLDATRLIVRAGVAEGDRVVVRGADLINQIR